MLRNTESSNSCTLSNPSMLATKYRASSFRFCNHHYFPKAVSIISIISELPLLLAIWRVDIPCESV